MQRFIAVMAFLLTLSCSTLEPGKVELSPDELSEFNVTLYTEKEQLDLEGLLTLEGFLYDTGVLNGKYVLVNFGASWCPYCGREKPSLQWLYHERSNEQFAVLPVFVNEQIVTVRRFMEVFLFH